MPKESQDQFIVFREGERLIEQPDALQHVASDE